MFLLTEITILLTTIGIALAIYFKWTLNYWRRRSVPQSKPRIPWGNLDNPLVLKKGLNFKVQDCYNEFKANGHKHGGFYSLTQPVYLPVDPEYIKNIMARHFEYFVNRGIYYNEKADPLSAHLLNIEDERWRHLRAKLTPTFTSGKMKSMFNTLLDLGEQLREEVKKVHSTHSVVDIKELVSCFTMDIIWSCAFGLDCNSFKNPDTEYRKFGKKVFKPSLQRLLKRFITISFPNFSTFIGLTIFPKDVSSFFMNVFKDVLTSRESNNVGRNDFVQILIDLNNKRHEHPIKSYLPPLTSEEMSAQAFLFFLAGFETSATTLTFCFYELAKNSKIQQKTRDEINSVLRKYDGNLTYEGIMEMKYMDQVIDETLRKYPPVLLLHRVCSRKYKVSATDVVLDKGTKVFISVLGLHHDPDHYPEPEKFDPDRFTESNKVRRHKFTFLPFGGGPRNCIGLRFALMQMKIGIALLLLEYNFTLNEKTSADVKLDQRTILLKSAEDILLNVEKVT